MTYEVNDILLIFQYLFLSFKAVLTDFFPPYRNNPLLGTPLIFKLRIQTLLETYEFKPEFP